MNISIVGTGYVGLVTGVCLAAKGHTCLCVDVDAEKVAQIQGGRAPIHEQGLEALLGEVLASGRFTATTNLRSAVLASDVTLIAVGTPTVDGGIDLSFVEAAAAEVGEALADKPGYHVVAVKSTVVPGTTEDVVLPILEQSSGRRAGAGFGVGMNPEFLKEGEAIADFMSPDRIVAGGIDDRSRATIAAIYEPFPGVDVVRTTARTAELIKYTANSLLATMISFSNEVANLCATTGVDVVDVMQGVHLDKRLSPILADGTRVRPGFLAYLEAGCGFGGSCFPKDVAALARFGEDRGLPMRILRSVLTVNAERPREVLGLLESRHAALEGLPVTILGMAFKPGTDDIRESPAIAMAKLLIERGARVTAYDPIARLPVERELSGQVRFVDDLAASVVDARAIVLMTSWPEFNALPEIVESAGGSPTVIDGRRMLSKDSVADYVGIGLG